MYLRESGGTYLYENLYTLPLGFVLPSDIEENWQYEMDNPAGSKKGIQPEHAPKLGRMLDRLDASISPQDMNLPGYRLHPLKGDKQDMWAVTVNGNWRLTFYFEGQDAYLLDYQDYH